VELGVGSGATNQRIDVEQQRINQEQSIWSNTNGTILETSFDIKWVTATASGLWHRIIRPE
jgi:hypothetical protein